MKITLVKAKIQAALIAAGIGAANIYTEAEWEKSERVPPSAIILAVSETAAADGRETGANYDEDEGEKTAYTRTIERRLKVAVRLLGPTEEAVESKTELLLEALLPGWWEPDADGEWIECREAAVDWLDDQSQLDDTASALITLNITGGFFAAVTTKAFESVTAGDDSALA
jgi:hypothetical protein